MNIQKYLSENIGIESDLRKFIRKDNPIIFDVGSCEGEDSIRYSKIFPGCKIYAFEPIESNFFKAKNNLHIHGVNCVEIYNEALSDNVGVSQMFVSSGHPDYLPQTNEWDYGNKSSSLLPPKNGQPSWMTYTKKDDIITNTIDNFCLNNNIQSIDFIHMDVQGCEVMVLSGAKNMLSKIGLLWLEVGMVEFYDGQPMKSDVIDFLTKNNFTILKDTCPNINGDILAKNNEYNG